MLTWVLLFTNGFWMARTAAIHRFMCFWNVSYGCTTKSVWSYGLLGFSEAGGSGFRVYGIWLGRPGGLQEGVKQPLSDSKHA